MFDAAMLVALWQFPKEDLVAGLLLFRVLYYIVPFVLALAILGVRELIFMRAHRVLPPPRTVEVTEPILTEIERRNSNAD